ncbi:hypothetical protein [Mangrovibacter plantisponsor]|nr:hypothetical protein [Mangrovibacter plantisponsor]
MNMVQAKAVFISSMASNTLCAFASISVISSEAQADKLTASLITDWFC